MSIKYDNKLTQIKELITKLLETILKADEASLDAYKNNDMKKYESVNLMLNNITIEGDLIDNEIIKIFALYGPEASELRTLVAYLKMTNEIVRIGVGVKKYASRMSTHIQSQCNLKYFSPTIIQLHKSTINSLSYILKCFIDFNRCKVQDFYTKTMVEESISDDLFSVLEKEIMQIIIDEKELSIEYVKILATLRKLERSCDRSVNIASLMLYAKNGGNINLYS